jgi:hypothetical protein
MKVRKDPTRGDESEMRQGRMNKWMEIISLDDKHLKSN